MNQIQQTHVQSPAPPDSCLGASLESIQADVLDVDRLATTGLQES